MKPLQTEFDNSRFTDCVLVEKLEAPCAGARPLTPQITGRDLYADYKLFFQVAHDILIPEWEELSEAERGAWFWLSTQVMPRAVR